MVYVFDTSSLVVLFRNFYPDNFPSLWKEFNHSVSQGQYLSVKEVRQEIDSYAEMDYLKKWSKEHKQFFLPPGEDEIKFISQMFDEHKHFQGLVKNKNILGGKPVADPFVIAKAKVFNSCVVSEEKYEQNAAKIPNVCKYFNIPHKNLKGFMKNEGWKF